MHMDDTRSYLHGLNPPKVSHLGSNRMQQVTCVYINSYIVIDDVVLFLLVTTSPTNLCYQTPGDTSL